MPILLNRYLAKIAALAVTVLCTHENALAATKITQKTAAANIPEFVERAAPLTGWSPEEITKLLEQAEYKPRIIELMDKPGEAMPWFQYKDRIVTKARVDDGLVFINTYKDALTRAEQTYGVPKEIIAAIIGVETRYGTNKGGFRVLDALTTLSFKYPRRASFFQQELVDFINLSKSAHFDPLTITGSYAGAIGWPQFMPSSARKLAVDFDGDGKIDLVESPVDAIGSIGSYFRANGWRTGELAARVLPSADGSNLTLQGANGENEYFDTAYNFEVIKRYNRSNLYAMAVSMLSEQLKQASN